MTDSASNANGSSGAEELEELEDEDYSPPVVTDTSNRNCDNSGRFSTSLLLDEYRGGANDESSWRDI
jgi:hypothetical protein